MFLAFAPQCGIIWFALESSRLSMGGRVSMAILGGNSPFFCPPPARSIELCVVLCVVTNHLGTYTVCAAYGSLPTDKPLCPDAEVCGPAIST